MERDKKRSRVEEEDDDISDIFKERLKLDTEAITLSKEIKNRHDRLQNLTKPNDDQVISEVRSKSNEYRVTKILHQQDHTRVSFIVGGVVFETTLKTASSQDTLLKILVETRLNVDRTEGGHILIEGQRDPNVFQIIIDYLRTGRVINLNSKSNEELKTILEETFFYGAKQVINHINGILIKRGVYEELRTSKASQSPSTPALPLPPSWEEEFANYTKQYQSVINDLKQTNSIQQQTITPPPKHLSFSFNIGGKVFKLDNDQLSNHPESILHSIYVQSIEPKVFIDRSAQLFEYIYTFITTQSSMHLPHHDRSIIRNLIMESRFYNISKLLTTRYPIEALGHEYIQIKKQEDLLRSLFATDRNHPILTNPHVHLIPLYSQIDQFKPCEPPASIPLLLDKQLFKPSRELHELHLEDRFHQVVHKLCQDLTTFKTQFNVFCGKLFVDVDWSNMVVAGGSVLASLIKAQHVASRFYDKASSFEHLMGINELDLDVDFSGLPLDNFSIDDLLLELINDPQQDLVYANPFDNSKKQYKDTIDTIKNMLKDDDFYYRNKTIRNYFRQSSYEKSDIDIFFYDMTPQQAVDKIRLIYQDLKKKCDGDVLIVRSGHSITFKSNSYRNIQIITRLYKSPAEVLIGFDVDCCTCCYDGDVVWCLPRFKRAINTRMNLVDVDRQSTTYELRLFKYAKRGFRVGVPGYDPELVVTDVPPALNRFIEGRQFTQAPLRRKMTGLAALINYDRALRLRMKTAASFLGVEGSNLIDDDALRRIHVETLSNKETKSDYSEVVVTHSTNVESTFFGLEKKLDRTKNVHRSIPNYIFSLNDLETILDNQKMESTQMGPITWMTVNPGTQSIGSFNPVDTNFYKDAYVRTKEQEDFIRKLVCLRSKLARPEIVTWSYWTPVGYQPFQTNVVREIEEHYQDHLLRDGMPNHQFVCDNVPNSRVSFGKMVMISDTPQHMELPIKREVRPV
ncbi:hypothetical protein AKO1_001970 [Acrasis kona]|uniref:BTB domain-containing protein n=1 Tax=Acrasis kona TaxID=1008807 RepID=A0AAW2ZAE9_9EUKA